MGTLTFGVCRLAIGYLVLLPCVCITVFPDPSFAASAAAKTADVRRGSPPAEAAVRLHGVVTGFSGWKNSLFLQDSSDAISINRLANVRDDDQNPRSIRILLRSSQDIQELSTPYWSSSLLLLFVVVL